MIGRDKGIVIRSGGINTDEFSLSSINIAEIQALRHDLKIPDHAKCVVMIAARLIWSKGVREFVEAAKILKEKYPEWKFVMLCPRDDGSPDAVPLKFIEANRIENLIVIDSFRSDIKNIIALAEIMVLVSYYPEGVPRSLLEGLSMSKPIVTSNRPGCKEVVDEGKNGYLVPAKDTQALVMKLETLIINSVMRTSFGQYSRRMAEDIFDDKIVINKIITHLYKI
jgi:N,N'-diacetylbacillosaminyl-diphospho-undecaprenol alpha-1,3-N-acetylgalactosaminyltransferase